MPTPSAAPRVLAALLGLGLAAPAQAAPLAVGQRLAPFRLPQADGGELDLAALAGRRAFVLAFVSARCPGSTAYDSRLAEFAREYAPRGVALVGVDSNAGDAASAGAAQVRGTALGFPVLRDQGDAKAHELGIQFVPEVLVFGPDWTLRYRGRIDDDPAGSAVPSGDLKAAVDAVLAGREVRLKQTRAFGCAIEGAAGQEEKR